MSRLPVEATDEARPSRKRSLQEIESDSDEDDVDDPSPTKRPRRSTSTADSDSASALQGAPSTKGRSVGKTNGHHEDQSDEESPELPKATPGKRGRPPKNRDGDTPTPRGKQRQTSVRTPTKSDTASRVSIGADRSARRKSARALIEKVVGDEDSEGEQDADGLVREIYESSDEEEEEEEDAAEELPTGVVEEELAQPDGLPDTPSKTPARRARKRAKSPTPPRDLPPHELYFLQNKPGRPKTSNNTLASLDLLSHEEYFTILGQLKDRHEGDIEYLESLHAESFPQWTFELSQGFSICLYGFGSKRSLLRKYARHLHQTSGSASHKIVMVNGYAPSASMREILSTAGLALNQRIPTAAPSSMAHSLLSYLSSPDAVSRDTLLTIVVNSIDAPPLRRPAYQATLAQLAAHPRLRLVCSADTPDFPLVWDVGLRSAFSFAFHDATTFAPYTVELDVVDDVHELLGRKARRVNGREGVAFVLRSLPENARNLFQLLVGEVLIAMEEDVGAGEDVGVEYRMVYNKSVEEFICSSEMAFRTLLKEFHDHQIITSRKDALGTELLSVPFRKEELEAILEDLMG